MALKHKPDIVINTGGLCNYEKISAEKFDNGAKKKLFTRPGAGEAHGLHPY